MVNTRKTNKDARPAAPVMTKAAKIKVGVPTKHVTKAPSKGEKICILEAHLAAYEDPDDTVAMSQEPLVSRLLSFVPLADFLLPS